MTFFFNSYAKVMQILKMEIRPTAEHWRLYPACVALAEHGFPFHRCQDLWIHATADIILVFISQPIMEDMRFF